MRDEGEKVVVSLKWGRKLSLSVFDLLSYLFSSHFLNSVSKSHVLIQVSV